MLVERACRILHACKHVSSILQQPEEEFSCYYETFSSVSCAYCVLQSVGSIFVVRWTEGFPLGLDGKIGVHVCLVFLVFFVCVRVCVCSHIYFNGISCTN